MSVYWLIRRPRTKMYRLLCIPALLSVLKCVKTNLALALSVATVGTAIIRTKTPAAENRFHTTQADVIAYYQPSINKADICDVFVPTVVLQGDLYELSV